ncbi:hypothetical protein [Paraburkholderia sp. J8-2]|uniref:hypothetical protein n=1 Tax=Paraburkholderia sp. J8-2 TaxID=2805440 RepID=UPI002AB76E9B|nr:hypothetical protein [Paraburkholderia sp. J8-2]
MAQPFVLIMIGVQTLVWLRIYSRTHQRKGYAVAIILSILALLLAALGHVTFAYALVNLGFTITCLLSLGRLRSEFHASKPREGGLVRLLRTHSPGQWARVLVAATLATVLGTWAFTGGGAYGVSEGIDALVIALGIAWMYWSTLSPDPTCDRVS